MVTMVTMVTIQTLNKWTSEQTFGGRSWGLFVFLSGMRHLTVTATPMMSLNLTITRHYGKTSFVSSKFAQVCVREHSYTMCGIYQLVLAPQIVSKCKNTVRISRAWHKVSGLGRWGFRRRAAFSSAGSRTPTRSGSRSVSDTVLPAINVAFVRFSVVPVGGMTHVTGSILRLLWRPLSTEALSASDAGLISADKKFEIKLRLFSAQWMSLSLPSEAESVTGHYNRWSPADKTITIYTEYNVILSWYVDSVGESMFTFHIVLIQE